MKKLLLLLMINAIPMPSVLAQLSGILTVGDEGNYPGLDAAVQDVNANGLNGNTILEIKDGYEKSENIHIESYPGNEQYTLTIRPEEGATEVIVRASGTSIIEMDSTNNIIIDGRPGGKTNSCVLKLMHSSRGNSSTFLIHDSKNSIIRYCFIRHDGTRGVEINYCDSSLVEHCDIATNTTGPISNGATIGIQIYSSSNTIIRNNSIHNLHVESVNSLYGIYFYNIDVKKSVDSVYNNFIALNTEATDSSVNIRGFGINDNDSSHMYFYFNSIYIGGVNIKNGYSFVIDYDSHGEADIRNNIFINKRSNGSGNGIHYGMHILQNGTAPIASDYNLIESNGIGGIVGCYTGNGQLDTTLLDWQSHTGLDMNSVSKEVEFQEIETGDLHLAGSSLNDIDLYGTFIAGINDIDGEQRWADSTYMGADQPIICIPGTAADPDNILENGDFEACTLAPWSLFFNSSRGVNAGVALTGGTCEVTGISLAADPLAWDIQLNQVLSPLQTGKLETGATYIVTFNAKLETGVMYCRVSFEQSVDPWTNIYSEEIFLDTTFQSYSLEFVLDTVLPDMQLSIQTGLEIATVSVDNVRLVKKAVNAITDDYENPETIRIMPNPANGYLNIVAKSASTARLFNSSGILVKEFRLTDGETQLDVTDLPEGFYLVKVNDGMHKISIVR